MPPAIVATPIPTSTWPVTFSKLALLLASCASAIVSKSLRVLDDLIISPPPAALITVPVPTTTQGQIFVGPVSTSRVVFRAVAEPALGGAANALGLARMIMMAGLPVRLRVLVPAVENSVSGNAFRPMDVLRSRAGITVEIGNTDAEGRLILADALFGGAAEKPEMMIDFATLTGAARVALGPELPVMFANNDELAADLAKHGAIVGDPVWGLPLWKPYRRTLKSNVADLNNIGEMNYNHPEVGDAQKLLREIVYRVS